MQDGPRIDEAVPQGIDAQPVEGQLDETLRPSWRVIGLALLYIAGRAALWPFRKVIDVAVRLVSLIMRWYVHRYVHISSKAKCPACGVLAKHDVRWSPLHSAVLHVCARCQAPWTEQPLVQAEHWRCDVIVQEDDGSTQDADGTITTTVQTAQREPQISKDVRPTGRNVPMIVRMKRGGGDVA